MANLFFDEIVSAGADAAPFLRAPGGIAWSYADLRREAARMAAALAAKGVKPGDRVAAQIEKSPRGLTLYLGTVMSGGVFLPLNTAYTSGELEYFLGDAEPALVVCDPGKRDAIARIAGTAHVETLGADGRGSMAEAADAGADGFAPVARVGGDLAAILYTSGTTGRSKGAMLTHANLVSNALALADIWRFASNDVLLHALPIYHTHGLFVACNTVMRAGASLIFLPKFEPAAMVREMAAASVMMGVPTFYTRLLGHTDFKKEHARDMRLFVSGSAPLLAETHREWTERTGHAILERYGMTETNMNTSNPYDGERRPGTVGFQLPEVALRVADPESGRDLGREEIGVIEVKGPNVFEGYWRLPEKTAAEFRPDGFFITGDLGKIDADGYVHIVGRGKDLIISGGFNVYPKEVELEIDALDGVLESAVIGLPHKDFGEGVAAVVVPRPGAQVDEAAILKGLEGRLAKFKLPKRVMVADELPRNAMGKVQKAALRKQHKDVFDKREWKPEAGLGADMRDPKRFMVAIDQLPPNFPTHMHDPAFWEAFGRAVGTFGFLEETLGKAIFAYTGMQKVPEEQIDAAYEKWIVTLQHALSDALSNLIDRYGKAVRDHGELAVQNFELLLTKLKEAAALRNVLCHGSWSRKPDPNGFSIPYFVTGLGDKQKVFETPIDINYLRQLQLAVVELACEVINTVTLKGWQFPGTTGPGICLWPPEEGDGKVTSK